MVERAKNGELGLAMQLLLGNGVPEGWTVIRENAFYRCPSCGKAVPGTLLRIEDGSNGWIEHHSIPDVCPSCREELGLRGDVVPMSLDELEDRCKSFAANGCPECGGKNVSVDFGNWD